MDTSAPVRGFRPMPVLRGFTLKTPNPRNSMRSPCSSAFFMVSKTVSTAISALVLVMPVRLTTSLIMSSLIKAPSLTQGQHHDKIRLIDMSSKAKKTPPPGVDKAEFCRTCAKFPTGVTIITVLDAEGNPHGMTASSFTSVSLDPPLVLVCVDHRATVMAPLRRAEHIGINVLSEDQQPLSEHFARRGHDRFDAVEWYAGHTGVPLIPGALASFECHIQNQVDAGDHTIFIAQVEYAEHSDGRPLVYFGSGYR